MWDAAHASDIGRTHRLWKHTLNLPPVSTLNNCLSLSCKGLLACVCDGGAVVVLDLNLFSGENVGLPVCQQLRASSPAECVCWSDDGLYLVVAFRYQLRVYNVSQVYGIACSWPLHYRACCLTVGSHCIPTPFARSTKYSICVGGANGGEVYTYPGSKEAITLNRGFPICAAQFSVDSRLLAVATVDGHLGVWIVGGGFSARTDLWHCLVPVERITSISFSPNGKYLALGGWDGGVYVYQSSHTPDLSRKNAWEPHVRCCSNTADVPPTHSPLVSPSGINGSTPPSLVAWSSNSCYVVCSDVKQNAIQIVNVLDGSILCTIDATAPIKGLAVSSNMGIVFYDRDHQLHATKWPLRCCTPKGQVGTLVVYDGVAGIITVKGCDEPWREGPVFRCAWPDRSVQVAPPCLLHNNMWLYTRDMCVPHFRTKKGCWPSDEDFAWWQPVVNLSARHILVTIRNAIHLFDCRASHPVWRTIYSTTRVRQCCVVKDVYIVSLHETSEITVHSVHTGQVCSKGKWPESIDLQRAQIKPQEYFEDSDANQQASFIGIAPDGKLSLRYAIFSIICPNDTDHKHHLECKLGTLVAPFRPHNLKWEYAMYNCAIFKVIDDVQRETEVVPQPVVTDEPVLPTPPPEGISGASSDTYLDKLMKRSTIQAKKPPKQSSKEASRKRITPTLITPSTHLAPADRNTSRKNSSKCCDDLPEHSNLRSWWLCALARATALYQRVTHVRTQPVLLAPQSRSLR